MKSKKKSLVLQHVTVKLLSTDEGHKMQSRTRAQRKHNRGCACSLVGGASSRLLLTQNRSTVYSQVIDARRMIQLLAESSMNGVRLLSTFSYQKTQRQALTIIFTSEPVTLVSTQKPVTKTFIMAAMRTRL